MIRRHTDQDGQSISEQVVSEDKSIQYWRIAVPLPMVVTRFFRKRLVCVCADEFTTHDKYELHYRKAVEEENRFVDLI